MGNYLKVRYPFPLRILQTVALSAALSACGLTDPSGPHAEEEARLREARSLWRAQGVASYTYVASRSCFCAPEAREPATVTVRAGVIVSVVSVEGGVSRSPEGYHTVEGLFDLVQDAIDKNAATIRTEYDPARGYLTSAYIDLDERLADEEFSIEARALTPLT